ncbi:MAG: AmmeMemoRadiSam system protein B [Luteitalea sp.]|nr:AmmeMemoRadiSam system protein B [Luteitalea sp.]
MLHHHKRVAPVRKAAVAGTWYPGTRQALEAAIDDHLAAALDGPPDLARLVALIAPHAGLTYSGGVAAYAYRQLRHRDVDLVVLAGPSHFVGFDGVAVYRRGGFDSPLGIAEIDEESATAMMRASATIREHDAAHAREHSLEMQLPFVRRLLPRARILPLVMGWQTAATATALADALAVVLRDKRAVIVASTDLSHYQDANRAAALDAVVIDHVRQFNPEGLQRALAACPEHACGGGPAVAVMCAARALGARDAVVLKYGDSGDVSGDKSAVVGYLAAAFGIRDAADD